PISYALTVRLHRVPTPRLIPLSDRQHRLGIDPVSLHDVLPISADCVAVPVVGEEAGLEPVAERDSEGLGEAGRPVRAQRTHDQRAVAAPLSARLNREHTRRGRAVIAAPPHSTPSPLAHHPLPTP